jgi:hypothetical protein
MRARAGQRQLILFGAVPTITPMIAVILLTESGKEIARVGWPDNEATLRRQGPQFRLLSELTPFSPDAFGRDDVPNLVAELESTLDPETDPRTISRVREIIALVQRCAAQPGTHLLFTPFA